MTKLLEEIVDGGFKWIIPLKIDQSNIDLSRRLKINKIDDNGLKILL